MKPQVSIIILNWNGWKDTIECLESLYQIDYPNYDVILVDNHSEDGSIKKIKQYCNGKKPEVESEFFDYTTKNKPVKIFECSKDETENATLIDEFKEVSSDRKLLIIKNDNNYGFAEGNNIALRYAAETLDQDYFLLLNNDTVVDKNFLTHLIENAEKKDDIGIVGPKVYKYAQPDAVDFAGGTIDLWRGKTHHINSNELNDAQTVDYIEGCCILLKKEVIEGVGLLNSDYFAYWEETDLCMRAKKEGFKILCIPEAKIWHKISSSTKKISEFSEYYFTRNMFWFMKEYAKKGQYLSFLLYFFIFGLWFRMGTHLFYYKNFKSLIWFLRGIWHGIYTF